MFLLAEGLDINSFAVAASKDVQLVVSEGQVKYHSVRVFAPIACLANLGEAHLDGLPVRVIDLTVLYCVNLGNIEVHVLLDISQTKEHLGATTLKPHRRLVRVGWILLCR